MAVLIDTSILIAYERGTLDVNSHVAGREDEPFFLSVISASELLHGVDRAQESAVRARRLAFVESILGPLSLARDRLERGSGSRGAMEQPVERREDDRSS